MLSIPEALLASGAMIVVIYGCRALPFLFFSNRKEPAFLAFLERYMPAIAMTIMAISAYTAIRWKESPHGIPELAAGTLVVALHIWKRNALLSIIGGTILYMALGKVF
jgi:branched-subunit amino acid transport protein AzlD